jgi:hypothetical protein
MTTWLQTLDSYPIHMAREVAALLPSATLDGYKRFLNMMFHYTLQSQSRLHHASLAATDPIISTFLQELAHDEAHHYKLALADLAQFNLKPTSDTPAEVLAFEKTWADLPTEDAAAHLGALVSLEGVGDHIGPDAVAFLKRLGLGKPHARFILVHLEADVEHGGLARAHAEHVGAQHSALVLRGAHDAAQAWISMHRCLLDP